MRRARVVRGRMVKAAVALPARTEHPGRTAGPGGGTRLALFTNKFPIKEATFFARDVRGLLEAGISVDIFPMRRIEADLWRWVPAILDERWLPREHVRGLHPVDALKGLRAGSLRSLPGYLREAAAICASAVRFGPGPLLKSVYAILLAWVWVQKYGTGYDHIMSYWGNYAATSAYLAHRLMGKDIPFSFLLHAGTDLYRDQVFMEEKLLYADMIYVVCDFNREFIRKRFPRAYPRVEEKIRLHHLGLDFSEFRFVLAGRRKDRVLCVGRFDRLKGFEYVLRAAIELRRRGLDPEVEIVGDGDEARTLKALASGAGLRARFPGWLSSAEVQREMSEATVLVHPSTDIGDAVPTVIKEAAAVGLPVVATRVAGIPEILDHGRCGVLVPPRDVLALADAMETMLKNEALRKSYAVAARLFAEERFDLWENGRMLAKDLATTVRGAHVAL